jgi:hypothetical protein
VLWDAASCCPTQLSLSLSLSLSRSPAAAQIRQLMLQLRPGSRHRGAARSARHGRRRGIACSILAEPAAICPSCARGLVLRRTRDSREAGEGSAHLLGQLQHLQVIVTGEHAVVNCPLHRRHGLVLVPGNAHLHCEPQPRPHPVRQAPAPHPAPQAQTPCVHTGHGWWR